MFKKLKPEKIAGIVALSYLILIPAGAGAAYLKLRSLEDSIDIMWDHLNLNRDEEKNLISVNKLKRMLS